MKAVAVFPVARRVSVVDHPEPPPPGPTEIRMRMLDVGICGTDKEIVNFQYGEPPDESEYLILGHESLGEVIETGAQVTRFQRGDLAVPTVRRPCTIPSCLACRAMRQDFCFTGRYTERGIMRRHGYMTEIVVEDERYLNPVPRVLRDVGVLVEPLTVAEKAFEQLSIVERRFPWINSSNHRRALVLGAGPVGLLGAMKLVLAGFDTTVYSRTPPGSDLAGLCAAFGASFVRAETTPVAAMAEMIGNIDVVYEATGVASLAFDTLRYLGSNGVFIFTGVPPHSPESPLDTGAMMRDYVLKNQLVLGTVNASVANFQTAIHDLGTFFEKWPDALRTLITLRVPIEKATDPLSCSPGGIKTVISIAP
jgi:glucose 1-dehydrogenase